MYKDNPGRVDCPEFNEADDPLISHAEILAELSDPVILWEALSEQGVAEPYPWGGTFYEQRQNAIYANRVEDAILIALQSKNYQELGEILFDQATTYAERQITHRS